MAALKIVEDVVKVIFRVLPRMVLVEIGKVEIVLLIVVENSRSTSRRSISSDDIIGSSSDSSINVENKKN